MANNKIMRFVVSAVVLVALMTLTAFAADITGGFGAIGGVDDTYYAAPATLNAAGTALELGEAIRLTTENNTGLAGLYAVSTDSTFEGDYEIIYVYGDIADRKDLFEKNTWIGGGDLTDTDDGTGHSTKYPDHEVKVDGTKTYVVGIDEDDDGLDDTITPAKLVYTSGSGDSAYLRVRLYTYQQIDATPTTDFVVANASGERIDNAYLFYNGANILSTTNYPITAAMGTAFVNAADETAKSEAFGVIADAARNRTINYALTQNEIIPVSEVNSYTYNLEVYKSDFVNEDHIVKFEAYVADDEGVHVYTYLHNALDLTKASTTFVVDFEKSTTGTWSPKAPTDGYLVGFKVYPYWGLTDYTKFTIGTADTRTWFTHSGYSIDTPKAPKPTGLGVDANGALTGTIPGMTYEYANLNDTSRLKEFAETGAATTALTYTSVEEDTVIGAGLYAVRVVGVDGEYDASDFVVVYNEGASINNILHYNETTGAIISQDRYQGKGWRITSTYRDTRFFTKGSWDGVLGYNATYGTSLGLFDTGDHNLLNWAHKQYSPGYTGSDAKFNLDYAGLVHAVESEHATYQYEDDEVVDFSKFVSYSYKTDGYRSSIGAVGDVYTKIILYIIDKNGNFRSVSATEVMDFNGLAATTHKFEAADFGKVDGYIVAMEIHPTGYVPSTTTLSLNGKTTNSAYNIFLLENGYVLKTAQATPEVAVSGNVLTVSNFVEGTTYAYSIDEGLTWTNFTSETVALKKALVYPHVKALADATHFESEVAVSESSTNGVVFTGASLVLDGKIGLRLYFDVDTENVSNWTQWKFSVKDSTTGSTVVPITTYRFSRTPQSTWNVATFADERTAYITVYVAPKDFDNFYIENSAFYWYANSSNNTTNLKNITSTMPGGSSYKVSNYITAFEEQVKAGNEECIAAEDLVDALKAYCENADAYFNTEAEALDTVEADTNAINTIEEPSKLGKFTYGDETILEHHSTSLILEENVTIRHYFKWTRASVEGQPTLTAVTVTAAETNGKAVEFNPENVKDPENADGYCYYYVDITDIDAKNLDTQYELKLTLKPSEDAEEQVITVKYSALNYVKQSYNDSNKKLANLVKAIYNYSAEAEEYLSN